MKNHTIMQYFEWHSNDDGQHWNRLKEDAHVLSEKGIDAIWLPPITKADHPENTGYSVYDLYDLGEFDQKNSVRTKYGTKEELKDAIEACHAHGIMVYADIVMNHKAGGDETETFEVIEVDINDRLKEISEPFEIEGFTKFNFDGRNNQYSDFKWNFTHFNGTDYDHKTGKRGVFRILGENKGWNDNVDDEHDNFDYLMFSNVDFNHPDVRNHLIEWGKWLVDEINIDGMRLDAIKHIDSTFIRDFIHAIDDHVEGNFYFLGEYWRADLESSKKFLSEAEHTVDLFDVALHFNLKEASEKGASYDLSKIFDGTFVQANPLEAVTFVDNHDSQPGESLESFIQEWFKQSAYALILLRYDGYPCVFFGDYYGIGGDQPVDGLQEAIDPLLYIRKLYAYGEQDDYLDHPNVIGWVRRGVEEIDYSGCAVIINNAEQEAEKIMHVGVERAGEVWLDYLNTRDDEIIIDDEGNGVFKVNPGSVSVYCQKH